MISPETRHILRSVAWALVNSVDVIRTGVTRPGQGYHAFLAGTVRADICHARILMSDLRASTATAQWPVVITALREQVQDVRRVVLGQPLRRAS